MDNLLKIEIKKSEVRIGDTLLVDGILTTIGKKDIKHCSFMGTSIFGDASPKLVTKVLFIVPTSNGIKYR